TAGPRRTGGPVRHPGTAQPGGGLCARDPAGRRPPAGGSAGGTKDRPTPCLTWLAGPPAPPAASATGKLIMAPPCAGAPGIGAARTIRFRAAALLPDRQRIGIQPGRGIG